LKNRHDLELIDYWDEHLVEPSMKIHRMRLQHCNDLQKILAADLGDLLEGIPVELEFRRGWSQELELGQALAAQRQRDIRSGFTNSGIHRDDLLLTSNGIRVDEVLSRGQGKRLCLALLLAALRLVGEKTGKRIILLIDDLHSELDQVARESIYKKLLELDLQLFVSNIDRDVPVGIEAKDFKMFHVEHGTIKPRNFS
jgi:DNA replication and repair protein RecF